MKQKPLLWAFLAGAGLIIAIRLAFPGLGGAIAAAVVAVIVVGLLGWYYWRSELKRRDRAGDDLYYLGLLLTLVSLIYALVLLFIVRDAGDGLTHVDTMIGNFGISLVSTVAGILGRILLQDSSGESRDPAAGQAADRAPRQRGQEDAQKEQDALLTAGVREATANMLQLRRDLREAADAFAHFTRVTLSHAEHIKSHTQQLVEGFNQHMAAVAERGLDDTGAVWQRVGETMRQDSETMLRGIEAAVSGATERTAEAWRGLAGQIESASAAARNRLEADAAEMEATLAHLERANGALGSLASALDGAQRQVSALGETASTATAAVSANATETLAAQQALVEGSKASQTAALESFSAATLALTDAAGKQMAEQARAWQTAVDDFHAAGQAQRQQSERAINALIASLAAAEQGVAGLGRAASAAAAGAEARVAEVVETLNGVAQGARQQQEASLSAWQDSASTFSGQARAHLAREMDAWRELLDGFNTSENAKRLSAETSRLADLINRLDRLLNPVDGRR